MEVGRLLLSLPNVAKSAFANDTFENEMGLVDFALQEVVLRVY